MTEDNERISKLLCEEVKNYFFGTLKHSKFTAVQKCTIEYMLNNYDCVVQAPTGSGKTLAYLLPTMQILKITQKKENPETCEINALIIVPSKELADQIGKLAKPLCDSLGFNLLRLIGGTKQSPEKLFKGKCVVIATPGRMEHLLEKMTEIKDHLKRLEVLIIDEADRFSATEFRKNITSVLAVLPKQRRTGLYSATQAKEVEEMLKFGLRNPVRLNVTAEKKTLVGQKFSENEEARTKKAITPLELTNYFMVMDARKKMLALVEFLKEHLTNSKILLFLCSAASVEYLANILPLLLDKKKLKILALHGKKKNKRLCILEDFRKSKECILLSTDLMARGLDIVDINWVLQFDIPRQSSMFIHRSGRSGRNEKSGFSLLFLTKEEISYVEFVQNHEKINLHEMRAGELTDEKAETLRNQVQSIAVTDRKILENGSRAFVSLVQAYCKHDCQIVCQLKELDMPGIAYSFGLIRMPQLRELKGTDLSAFKPRDDIRTSTIAYLDPDREAKRQEQLKFRKQESNDKKKSIRADAIMQKTEVKRKRKNKGSDWDDFQEENNLLKKYKKGKLSKNELNELLGNV